MLNITKTNPPSTDNSLRVAVEGTLDTEDDDRHWWTLEDEAFVLSHTAPAHEESEWNTKRETRTLTKPVFEHQTSTFTRT